jgi:hypothetical protein
MVVIASAAVALGASRSGGSNTYVQDQQAFTFWGHHETTSKKAWDSVAAPTFGAGAVQSQGVATASISVKAEGGPVAVRLLWDGSPAFEPGSATFSPEGHDASSFVFILPESQPADCHHFTTEFKSPTGRRATITSLNVVLDYQGAQQTPSPIAPCE